MRYPCLSLAFTVLASLVLPGCFLDRAPLPGDAGQRDGGGVAELDGGSRDACTPATEACNGRDDDCDGVVDDGLTRACSTACGAGTESCAGGTWVGCTALQPAAETCNNLDDDCNGRIDDGLTRDCSTACGAGTERCSGGVWMGCDAPTAAAEACNDLDDDCNGMIDDGVTRPCTGTCGDGFQRCSGGVWSTTCMPTATSVETCNGIDDDCNGAIDDGLTRACSTACGSGTETCTAGAWVGCTAPPVATETCNAIDDDCDGQVDDGSVCPCAVRSHLGRTYMFCTSAADWAGSRATCTDHGYDLATIGSADENTWVSSTAIAIAMGDYWIGLNDQDDENTFVWASGASSYRAWSSGQPSNNPGEQDCVYIEDGSDTFYEVAGQWNDYDCGTALDFICEIP